MLRTSVLKVRQVRKRAVDWLALAGKVTTDGARTDVNRLRDLYDEINAAAKMYEGEVAAIDFAGYRKDISAPGIVDEFEVRNIHISIEHYYLYTKMIKRLLPISYIYIYIIYLKTYFTNRILIYINRPHTIP